MTFWKYVKIAMSESSTASSKRWLGTIALFVFMTLVSLRYDNESIRLLGYGAFALLGASMIKYFKSNNNNAINYDRQAIDSEL